MYTIASDWKLRINVSRTATIKVGKPQPIAAIEPDFVFTHNTIALIVASSTANPNWYKAGNLYQAFFVPFGIAGAAQGERLRVTLNRYIIHRFTTFPSTDENKYILSYVPESYYRDVKLQVWEYTGTNQGATLDGLETLTKAGLQRMAGLQTSLNRLLKKS